MSAHYALLSSLQSHKVDIYSLLTNWTVKEALYWPLSRRQYRPHISIASQNRRFSTWYRLPFKLNYKFYDFVLLNYYSYSKSSDSCSFYSVQYLCSIDIWMICDWLGSGASRRFSLFSIRNAQIAQRVGRSTALWAIRSRVNTTNKQTWKYRKNATSIWGGRNSQWIISIHEILQICTSI